MKIGIFADTHDRLPSIKKALKYFRKKKCAALIHAGDLVSPFAAKQIKEFEGEVHAVFGNNDGERSGLKKLFPKIEDGPLQVEIDGIKFLVIHERSKLPAKLPAVDVVVFGHTHDAMVEEGAPMFVNPGECCGWLFGKATVIIFDTEKRKAKIHAL